jgi:hypothetical protein
MRLQQDFYGVKKLLRRFGVRCSIWAWITNQ